MVRGQWRGEALEGKALEGKALEGETLEGEALETRATGDKTPRYLVSSSCSVLSRIIKDESPHERKS